MSCSGGGNVESSHVQTCDSSVSGCEKAGLDCLDAGLVNIRPQSLQSQLHISQGAGCALIRF